MAKQHWLVKTEPEAYAWAQFVRDGSTIWDGVRNFQARNHLRAMKVGDQVLFYASVTTKAVLGEAEVAETAFPDPSAEEGDWSAVRLNCKRAFSRPVGLELLKEDPLLQGIALLRQSRLSVMPLTKAEYARIVALGRS
jgi:predicted RNA-binding protein with PUA-like domain